MKFIISNRDLNVLDPYYTSLQSAKYSSSAIHSAHASYWQEMRKREMWPWRVIINNYKENGMANAFLTWLNNYITTEDHPKKKAFSFWGESNVNKSRMVRWFLKREYENNQVFVPHRREADYSFANWVDGTYSVVVIEEFNLLEYDPDVLKLLLEGETFTQRVKHKSSFNISLLGIPIILCSNISVAEQILLSGNSDRYILFLKILFLKTYIL
jgi:hypothetical protein